jgi:hypothetical protein
MAIVPELLEEISLQGRRREFGRDSFDDATPALVPYSTGPHLLHMGIIGPARGEGMDPLQDVAPDQPRERIGGKTDGLHVIVRRIPLDLAHRPQVIAVLPDSIPV